MRSLFRYGLEALAKNRIYLGPNPVANINKPPKLLDRVRQVLRAKHYAYRTEQSYVGWIKRYIFFHDKRHPREMAAAEIEHFLTHLAVEGNVSASTQTQALCALLFLYKHLLKIELPALNAVRAKRPKRLPVVLSQKEVRRELGSIDGAHLLESGADICTAPELLGHKDVSTTMNYTHVLQRGVCGVLSPLDLLLRRPAIVGAPKSGASRLLSERRFWIWPALVV